MKTFLKIFGFIVLILLLLAFIFPFLIKDKIGEVAKEEINKNVNATINFEDISLSMFHNFPNLRLGLKDLSVVGKNVFENDTLATIGSIDVVINLLSAITGDAYQINKISIIKPNFKIKVLEDGKSNYDIAVEEEGASNPEEESGESSGFNLILKKFEIVDGVIKYFDKSLKMNLEIAGLNHTLMGNFSADQTRMQTLTEIEKFDLSYEGIKYFNETKVNYVAAFDADLKNEIYTLKKNELKLNDLMLEFDGSVSMINEEDINLIMTFNAPKTDFKNLLSLVPAVYAKEFESIQTKGNIALDGHIKGIYNEENLPAFAVHLKVDDAMFKYPELPGAVENINIDTRINNSGGIVDNTVVDVSKFHMEMAGNPIDVKLLLKTPESDPDINGKIRGELDLGTIKAFYPLEEGEELSGEIKLDVTLMGKMSAVEEERYNEFTALGSMLLTNFNYNSSALNEKVEVINAQLNFSPAYLDLVSFKTKIGKNDFKAAGQIRNYLAYVLADETLVGKLKTSSDYFNVSTLMPEGSTEESTPETEEDSELSAFEIPANIDFQMSSSFKKLIYDSIDMENVKGEIIIRDQRIQMNNLYAELLDGNMNVNGYYDSKDIEKPEVKMELSVNDLDIQKAYSTFGIIAKYAPVAAKTSGNFSTTFNYTSFLDQEMMPLYETMNGKGNLKTSEINIKGLNTLDKIADLIKYDKLKDMNVDMINLSFKFVDGKILVDPFDLNQGNLKSTFGGWTTFDQQIDYVMALTLPRNELGSSANDVLNKLVNEANSKGAQFSLGDMVSLDVLIGGNLTDPTISTSLSDMGSNLIEDVKTQVKQEIEKKKEEVSQQAKEQAQKLIDDADVQAQKLIQEAEKQAIAIRKTANESAQKIRSEAETQAKKIEDEGKKNGPLAQIAAKEAAKKVRSEADNQANNVVTEANKQSNGIVNKSKSEAVKIKSSAQQKADKLLEVK